MQKRTSRLTPIALASAYIATVAGSAIMAFGSTASAASLSQVIVRFDRMKAATATTGTVCAKAANAGQTSVTVTFPTGYTVSTTTSNWATSTTNLAWPASASAWPTIGANATTAVGQVGGHNLINKIYGTIRKKEKNRRSSRRGESKKS